MSLAAKSCLKCEPFILILSQRHDCDAAVVPPAACLVSWVSLVCESCLQVCHLTVIAPLLNISTALVTLCCCRSISLPASLTKIDEMGNAAALRAELVICLSAVLTCALLKIDSNGGNVSAPLRLVRHVAEVGAAAEEWKLPLQSKQRDKVEPGGSGSTGAVAPVSEQHP